ncbi:hypothetical protein [Microcoleus sp. FACHB-672]|uniref:hypothetical protein n=1 Tax=Microcoleus sp. FACHB-672 TaxID=2692825 RepID=UPI0016839B3C|nr:hypothetical protein [Microcoleus sp. FACHB-672]MBD2040854.1 hypothetical protein [Microcoleus sp. FACHB-672]
MAEASSYRKITGRDHQDASLDSRLAVTAGNSRQNAILNAPYRRHLLKDASQNSPNAQLSLYHEAILVLKNIKLNLLVDETARLLLLDYEFYRKNIFWPATLPEALMSEPAMTKTTENPYRFSDALNLTDRDIQLKPEWVNPIPNNVAGGCVYQVKTVRSPQLTRPT